MNDWLQGLPLRLCHVKTMAVCCVNLFYPRFRRSARGC